jgi:hypothetical protein
MMVALLLYAYSRGVYPSRRIAQACEERVDFMAVRSTRSPAPKARHRNPSHLGSSCQGPSRTGRFSDERASIVACPREGRTRNRLLRQHGARGTRPWAFLSEVTERSLSSAPACFPKLLNGPLKRTFGVTIVHPRFVLADQAWNSSQGESRGIEI